MRREHLWMAGVAVLIALLVLTASIPFLTAAQYQALAGGVQAFGVTAALIYGAFTLHSDARNRKIDRTLGLHDALTSGEVQRARIRLVNHLTAHGVDTRVRQAAMQKLREDVELSKYANDSDSSPIRDANLVLRFMERANAARRAGIVDIPLFHELIGLHVLWWNSAIVQNESEPFRRPTSDLARWVAEYRKSLNSDSSYLHSWDLNLNRDFVSKSHHHAP